MIASSIHPSAQPNSRVEPSGLNCPNRREHWCAGGSRATSLGGGEAVAVGAWKGRNNRGKAPPLAYHRCWSLWPGIRRQCQAKNFEHVVVGKTMEFWKSNMPNGMYLRSTCDWHYDPFNQDTFERYLETENLKPADVEPLALDFYLNYVEWFVKQKAIEILPASAGDKARLSGPP